AKDVLVANDNIIEAVSIGRMLAKTSEGKHMSFQDMLHVPDVAHTLLSVSSMNDNGVDVTFKASGKVLLSEDDGTVIAEGYKKDGLYYLALQGQTDDTKAIACVINMNGDDTSRHKDTSKYTLWHNRMGHLSSTGLAKLPKVVDGMEEGETISTDPMLPTCEACIYRKQA